MYYSFLSFIKSVSLIVIFFYISSNLVNRYNNRSSDISCFYIQVCLWTLSTLLHCRPFIPPQEELEVCPVEHKLSIVKSFISFLMTTACPHSWDILITTACPHSWDILITTACPHSWDILLLKCLSNHSNQCSCVIQRKQDNAVIYKGSVYSVAYDKIQR